MEPSVSALRGWRATRVSRQFQGLKCPEMQTNFDFWQSIINKRLNNCTVQLRCTATACVYKSPVTMQHKHMRMRSKHNIIQTWGASGWRFLFSMQFLLCHDMRREACSLHTHSGSYRGMCFLRVPFSRSFPHLHSAAALKAGF